MVLKSIHDRMGIQVEEDEKMSLPDFIICGTQKGGTTALMEYLKQHPQICMPEREIHFFSWYYNKGIKWYEKYFDHDAMLYGEKSPSYMYPEPGLVAKRIHKELPSIKLIFMLRNPIKRAYSEYWMLVLNGEEKLPFSKAVWKKNRDYIGRGFYAKQIKEYLKYFDPENIKIIISEDFRENRNQRIKEVFRFLGIYPIEVETLDIHVGGMPKSKILLNIAGLITNVAEKAVINSPTLRFLCWDVRGFFKRLNKIEGKKPPMDEETKEKLYKYFKPHNEELIDLLKDLEMPHLAETIRKKWKKK